MTATRATSPQPGSASVLLRWQIELAHQILEDTIDNLSRASILGREPEALHPDAPDAPISAAACYAQIVYCEDVTVTVVLAGGRPLALTSWAGRTGLSALPPLANAIARPLAEQPEWSAWGRRVQIELAALRAYARAVHTATDSYLANLQDRLLDPARRELPGCLLNALLLTISMRRGEIASLLADQRQAATFTAPPTAARTRPRGTDSSHIVQPSLTPVQYGFGVNVAGNEGPTR